MYPGAHAATNPDKPAIIMAGTGQVVTYADLDAEANRLSQLFRAANLQTGDHIAFCLENQAHFLPIAWGAHYAGLVYTAMSSRLTTEEMAYIIDNSDAKAFITSDHKREQAAELVHQMPDVSLRLMVDGTIDGYESYEAAIATQPAEPLPDRIAGRDMLYSSGTTGRPKGVAQQVDPKPLDQAGSEVTNLLQLLFGASADSVYLSPAPFYHSAPLRFCMAINMLGATVVAMEHFDAEGYLRLVQEHQVTHSQVVPTMFVRILKLDPETRAGYDLSTLQAVVHAAAPCPMPVKQEIIDWWGPIIHEYYAGTEGNGFVYCNSEGWLAHPGTVGSAISGELHIVDEEGNEVPVGEEGTIYFSGGGEFEYHGDPDKTAESRDPRGWSTLGDIGKLDDDGFLYLTDRKAYMIISGGVNIYPQEAENVLSMHPKVFDVAVIGVPNADFGEEVKAIVQPAGGVEGGPELERELIAYCREHLADVKCPRTIDYRDELPRHPTGKLYKRLLKDDYWEGHQSRII
ncbi:MAG: AMP-binding protein [Actinomycetia bacterium]|nr:AMP-binding protein [Actinomycetes bacterium]